MHFINFTRTLHTRHRYLTHETQVHYTPDTGTLHTRHWYLTHQTQVPYTPDTGTLHTRNWCHTHQTQVPYPLDTGTLQSMAMLPYTPDIGTLHIWHLFTNLALVLQAPGSLPYWHLPYYHPTRHWHLTHLALVSPGISRTHQPQSQLPNT